MTKIKKISFWVFSALMLVALALFCVFQGKNDVMTVSAATTETAGTRVDNDELQKRGYVLYQEKITADNVNAAKTSIQLNSLLPTFEMTSTGRLKYTFDVTKKRGFDIYIYIRFSQSYDISRVLAVDLEHIFSDADGVYSEIPDGNSFVYELLSGDNVVGEFYTGYDHYNVDSSSCLPDWKDGATTFDGVRIRHFGSVSPGEGFLLSENFEVFYTEEVGAPTTGWENMIVYVDYKELVDGKFVTKVKSLEVKVGQDFLESDFYKNLPKEYDHVTVVGVEEESSICSYENMNFTVKYDFDTVRVGVWLGSDFGIQAKINYYETFYENEKFYKYYGQFVMDEVKYFSTVNTYKNGTWSNAYREKVNKNHCLTLDEMFACEVQPEVDVGVHIIYPVFKHELNYDDPDYEYKKPNVLDNITDGWNEFWGGTGRIISTLWDGITGFFKRLPTIIKVLFIVVPAAVILFVFIWLFMLIYRPLSRIWKTYKETDRYKERKAKRDERKRKRKEKRKRKKDERKKK